MFKLLNTTLFFYLVKFLPDANDVMQLLLKTQTEMEELEADDPQVGWLEDKHLVGENGQFYFLSLVQQDYCCVKRSVEGATCI